MKKKFLLIRLQEPTIPLIKTNAEFIVGQKVGVYDTNDEAEEAISDILDGPSASDLEFLMPADIGFSIIPFYS